MPNVIKVDAGVPILQEQAQLLKLCSSCARPMNVSAADNSDSTLPSDLSSTAISILCASCNDLGNVQVALDADFHVHGSEQNMEQSTSAPAVTATSAIAIPRQESSINFPSFSEVINAANNSPILDRGRSHPRQATTSSASSARTTLSGPHSRLLSLSPPAVALAHKSRGLSPLTRSIAASTTTLNPLSDITRVRVRSQGFHCLYPGATFLGYQTNNSKQHKVSVTILDVDLPSATLCGFMSIRGLTKQPEEMVTYFDGEIIGSRHGFLTQDWGSTDEYDLKHWERFPAFNQIPKKKFRYPRMTINDDENRGVFFMRWKEKFLYPDHKVQTINGASFDGFYYICLDFGNNGHQDSDDEGDEMDDDEEEVASGPSGLHHQHDSLHHMDMDLVSPSTMFPLSAHLNSDKHPLDKDDVPKLPPATLTGYYFHSEREVCDLYQKLHLHHVPKNTQAHFEFR